MWETERNGTPKSNGLTFGSPVAIPKSGAEYSVFITIYIFSSSFYISRNIVTYPRLKTIGVHRCAWWENYWSLSSFNIPLLIVRSQEIQTGFLRNCIPYCCLNDVGFSFVRKEDWVSSWTNWLGAFSNAGWHVVQGGWPGPQVKQEATVTHLSKSYTIKTSPRCWGGLLFLPSFFNDAFQYRDCMASSDGMISEWWIGKDTAGSDATSAFVSRCEPSTIGMQGQCGQVLRSWARHSRYHVRFFAAWKSEHALGHRAGPGEGSSQAQCLLRRLWTPPDTSLIHSSDGTSAALQSKKKSAASARTMVLDFAPIPIILRSTSSAAWHQTPSPVSA
jgi:hypothetical protein